MRSFTAYMLLALLPLASAGGYILETHGDSCRLSTHNYNFCGCSLGTFDVEGPKFKSYTSTCSDYDGIATAANMDTYTDRSSRLTF